MYYVFKIHDKISDNPWYIGISKNPLQRFTKLLKETQFQQKTRHIYAYGEKAQLEIVGKTKNLEEAKEIRDNEISALSPYFNKNGNKAGVGYHKHSALQFAIYWVLREEDIIKDATPNQREQDLLRKIVEAVKEVEGESW